MATDKSGELIENSRELLSKLKKHLATFKKAVEKYQESEHERASDVEKNNIFKTALLALLRCYSDYRKMADENKLPNAIIELIGVQLAMFHGEALGESAYLSKNNKARDKWVNGLRHSGGKYELEVLIEEFEQLLKK
jgi:hypothetical protein